MAKLTLREIDKITPPDKGYKIHWDDNTKGLGLRVNASGKMTYVVQGRVKRKSIRCTIGPHGRWTPDLARKQAKILLLDMDLGINPRESQKEEEIARVTLRQVADAYKRDRPLRDSSKAEIECHVTTTLKPWLNKPITSITRQDVTKRFNEVRFHGLKGKGPTPALANGGFGILRALINYARREYRKSDGSAVLTDNPVDVLYKKWAPVYPRTRRIPEKRVGEVWNALQAARNSTVNYLTRAGIELVMFLLLTGARFSEGASLTWDNVNLDEGWWHIPNPKNHNSVWLPLSSFATELLTDRKGNNSNFVFPSWSKSGHIANVNGPMKKIVSKVAGLHLSAHDLRRSFSNIGIATLKLPIQSIELLTNHVPHTVTTRHYLETQQLEYLNPEVQLIADWIDHQAKVAAGENVVILQVG